MSDPQFDAIHKGYDNSAAPGSQRGCFFYGCLIAAILMLIGLVLAGAVGYIGYSYVAKLVDEYTSTTPDTLPVVTISEEDRKALNDRFETFSKAADEGKSAEIVLTSDEINALIDENPQWKGKIYVTLKDDVVNARLNLPLDNVPLPGTKGRYLVGSGTLKVSIVSGLLDVRAQKIEVNGKPLPDKFMASFSGENLAKESNKDAEQSAKLRKIESLVVKNSKVRLKTKAKDAEDEAEEQKRVEAEEKKKADAKPDTPKPSDAEKKAEPEAPAPPKKEETPAKSAA
jgi:hypothetical protein